MDAAFEKHLSCYLVSDEEGNPEPTNPPHRSVAVDRKHLEQSCLKPPYSSQPGPRDSRPRLSFFVDLMCIPSCLKPATRLVVSRVPFATMAIASISGGISFFPNPTA